MCRCEAASDQGRDRAWTTRDRTGRCRPRSGGKTQQPDLRYWRSATGGGAVGTTEQPAETARRRAPSQGARDPFSRVCSGLPGAPRRWAQALGSVVREALALAHLAGAAVKVTTSFVPDPASVPSVALDRAASGHSRCRQAVGLAGDAPPTPTVRRPSATRPRLGTRRRDLGTPPASGLRRSGFLSVTWPSTSRHPKQRNTALRW